MTPDDAGTTNSIKRNGLDPLANTKLEGLSAGHEDEPSKLQSLSGTESITFPLVDYPELSIRRTWPVGGHRRDPICVEYVCTPKVHAGITSWVLWGLALLGLVYVVRVYGSDWFVQHRWTNALCFGMLMLGSKSVISESAVAYPNLGIQLESRMAFVLPFPFPFLCSTRAWVIPLETSKRFIPLSSIRSSSGIILHEYFRRWNVVYYLAVLGHAGMRETVEGDEVEDQEVHVIFPNTRPRYKVLLEVYYGLRETLYDDYNDNT